MVCGLPTRESGQVFLTTEEFRHWRTVVNNWNQWGDFEQKLPSAKEEGITKGVIIDNADNPNCYFHCCIAITWAVEKGDPVAKAIKEKFELAGREFDSDNYATCSCGAVVTPTHIKHAPEYCQSCGKELPVYGEVPNDE